MQCDMSLAIRFLKVENPITCDQKLLCFENLQQKMLWWGASL
eukprot:SAG11_NODE_17239_length_524_cov_1.002353_1_plen_41_part_10